MNREAVLGQLIANQPGNLLGFHGIFHVKIFNNRDRTARRLLPGRELQTTPSPEERWRNQPSAGKGPKQVLAESSAACAYETACGDRVHAQIARDANKFPCRKGKRPARAFFEGSSQLDSQPSRLIGGGRRLEDLKTGHENDVEIERQRPVFDVFDVQRGARPDVFIVLRFPRNPLIWARPVIPGLAKVRT